MIDRVSADDVMSLVSDRQDPPLQVGAVLLFEVDDHVDIVRGLAEALAHRVTSIPRLRQRLVDVPVGCGRPVWVDSSSFDFGEHFEVVRLPGPITEETVLAHAAERLTTRLPRDRPLWAATLLAADGDGRAALVLVFHHVLADGIAGLSLLGSLMDGASVIPAGHFPRPAPSLPHLVKDTAASRLRSVRLLPLLARRLISAVIELGPSLRR